MNGGGSYMRKFAWPHRSVIVGRSSQAGKRGHIGGPRDSGGDARQNRTHVRLAVHLPGRGLIETLGGWREIGRKLPEVTRFPTDRDFSLGSFGLLWFGWP